MGTNSLLGRQLDEYRLEALLGHSGMAYVYRGVDTRLDRQVAIKVIDPEHRANPDYAVRFEREAQAIAGSTIPTLLLYTVLLRLTGCFILLCSTSKGLI